MCCTLEHHVRTRVRCSLLMEVRHILIVSVSYALLLRVQHMLVLCDTAIASVRRRAERVIERASSRSGTRNRCIDSACVIQRKYLSVECVNARITACINLG